MNESMSPLGAAVVSVIFASMVPLSSSPPFDAAGAARGERDDGEDAGERGAGADETAGAERAVHQDSLG
ncbi:hypothetical protein [Microbacterium sp. Se5.02b]|uniref:hypothetical protein n=1 Tax=Microbacterium sp. Se5.02b TaxID=2864103 RepID=UPI001C6895E5|nr:hypothetical protein [Microbacterium sp. Se5.02b]QYM63900.1 hypothetical protein K1X59_17520 [Microbacterium sp. Se5.02b]